MLARPDYKIHFGYTEMGAGKVYDFMRGITHQQVCSTDSNQVYDKFVNSDSSAGGSIYFTNSYTYLLDVKFWNVMPNIFSMATYSVYGNLSRFRVNYSIPERETGIDKFQEINGIFSVSADFFPDPHILETHIHTSQFHNFEPYTNNTHSNKIGEKETIVSRMFLDSNTTYLTTTAQLQGGMMKLKMSRPDGQLKVVELPAHISLPNIDELRKINPNALVTLPLNKFNNIYSNNNIMQSENI